LLLSYFVLYLEALFFPMLEAYRKRASCCVVKPRIDRDSFLEKHQLKRGQEFNVEVKFIGEPPPKATWLKAKKVIIACLSDD